MNCDYAPYPVRTFSAEEIACEKCQNYFWMSPFFLCPILFKIGCRIHLVVHSRALRTTQLPGTEHYEGAARLLR